MKPAEREAPKESLGRSTCDRDGRLSRLVRDRMGVDLSPTKARIVELRLRPHLERLGLHGLDDFLDRIGHPQFETEQDLLASLVTTNVTAFFRENHHFEMLGASILPELIARARQGQRVRIWSAGCSAGQEPYSIAAVVLRVCPEVADLDLKILATDIDPEVLRRARAGVYSVNDFAHLAPAQRRMLVGDEDATRIRAELIELVRFLRLNLLDPWPMRNPFDVIFCRNVMIYFDRISRGRLWERFSDALGEKGHLFVGHAERVAGPAVRKLVHVGVTTYRKSNGTRPPASQA